MIDHLVCMLSFYYTASLGESKQFKHASNLYSIIRTETYQAKVPELKKQSKSRLLSSVKMKFM